MKLRWGILGLGAACAACCAPLILPVLAGWGLIGAGGLGAGLIFGLTLDQVLCYGVPAIALAALLILAPRRRASKTPAAACACDPACDVTLCGPDVR